MGTLSLSLPKKPYSIILATRHLLAKGFFPRFCQAIGFIKGPMLKLWNVSVSKIPASKIEFWPWILCPSL